LRLVIEVDREIHTEKKIQNHDISCTGEPERLGIKVIRFTINQILHESNLVSETITATIKGLTTTF
jgi:very-short-patch-repair endonuclease